MGRALAVEGSTAGGRAAEIGLTELTGAPKVGGTVALWTVDGERRTAKVRGYDEGTSRVTVTGFSADALWPHSEVVFGKATGSRVVAPFVFASDAAPAERITRFAVQIPTSVRNRAHILDVLERGLQSPARFSSWKVLEKQLGRLEWLGKGDVRIVHTTTPFDALSDLGAYARVLSKAVAGLKRRGRRLIVVFPFGARERLEVALTMSETVRAAGRRKG